MEFSKYYIENKDGKSNCVIRSFCKLYNKSYDEVYNELISISKKLNANSFNDIEVFEYFMEKHNTYKIDVEKDILIKNLKLDSGSYIVFCYDKKDFYHMVVIINNILYDKNDKSFDLNVIDVYKKELKK